MQARINKEGEHHHFASSHSCCPVSFFSSPSPVKARAAADAIFNYDIGLLREEQAALDMPWAPEDTDREHFTQKKATDRGEEGNEDDDTNVGAHDCLGRRLLHCCKSNALSRSLCGVMCNPLLTSRLALMGLLAALLITITVLTWVLSSTNMQRSVGSIAAKFRRELLLRSEDNINAVFQGNGASTISLSTFLSSQSGNNASSPSSLEEEVRPALFLVFSVLAKKARVAYFASSGFLLLYGADAMGTYLTYSNTTYLSPPSFNSAHGTYTPWRTGENLTITRPWYQWFRQRVDDNTGHPVGDAVLVPPVAYWESQPLQSVLQGHAGGGASSWGYSPADAQELIFSFQSPVFQSQSAAPIAAVVIGIPTLDITNHLNQINIQGGAMFLTSTDGYLLAQTGTIVNMDNTGQSSMLATESNNALVARTAEHLMPYLSTVSTMATNESFTKAKVEIFGTIYSIDSAPLHLGDSTLILTVVLPHSSLWGLTDKWSRIILAVIISLATCMGIVGCFFVMLLTKGVSNEMRLRAALIQQLEETKRAETKSSHKSLVFANMSHDLRTPLAAILGLIDLCLGDASEFSEMGSNLIQMKSCATNLLGILNSILDMSKIEAGKLLLQESEFNLVAALEEVVDTFSVVGLKKGIEIALDLSDGFVEKASWVIGDVGRVKQIMANLLSNGVKFTSEGHVVLRGWVRPLGVSYARPQSGYRGRLLSWPWNQLLRSPSRDKELRKLILGFSEKDQDENYIHVEFEVDDTGRGIPKERWKSVFENFVQVESSGPRNYDGTGLGLGIVRSLVKLMGGDIKIIDKDEPGEPGTRFRFDLVFKCRKQLDKHDSKERCSEDRALLRAAFGVGAASVSPLWHLNPSETFAFTHGLEGPGLHSPPLVEGVHVLLAMQGQAGKRIVKRWMERRGLQVWTLPNWEEFVPAVERIRHEAFSASFSTSGRMVPRSPESRIHDSWVDDLDVKSYGRDPASFDTCLQGIPTSDGTESAQKLNIYGARGHFLLIVDISMAMTSLNALCADLVDVLVEEPQSLPFRVAWLTNANTPSTDIHFLRSQTRVCHLIVHKPVYASRLTSIWGLLQELVGNGGTRDSFETEAPPQSPVGHRQKVDLSAANSLYTSLSCMSTFQQAAGSVHSSQLGAAKSVKADAADLVTRDRSEAAILPSSPALDAVAAPQAHGTLGSQQARTGQQLWRSDQHALSNMHILVAEDNPILQRLTKTQLIRLGATVEVVDNGAEAARLVLENLYKSKASSSPEDNNKLLLHRKLSGESTDVQKNLPFNLVLMDCEMPILNGYEATQRIRSEESRYGIRTPVIALTAHAMTQDERKCIEAGMDFYLTKPLSIEALLDAVAKLMQKSP